MQPDEFQDILYENDVNGILTVTINRPERKNALSPRTLLELWYAVDNAEKDEKIKIMILTGAKKANAFCSGGYFTQDFHKEIPKEYINEIDLKDMASKKLCLKFWGFEKPVITAINGLAVGGGFTLPLVCSDLVYISEDAWIGFYFIKRAVMPDFATSYLLPLLVGFQKAKELFFFGERITAREAFDMGLGINQVLPSEELMDYTRQQAMRLIPPQGPSLAIKLMKKTMHSYFRDIIETQLDLENKGWRKTLKSKDFKRSIIALKEKKPTEFIGK
ncbi:MAG: 3-hydroxypropionyl-coenzyme A dehydratase [Promethearchaeota archaeon]|nr:MAG: 3-hydroxypropionyl-coenzyme A dehydratase [Candidatus Lokiarchaeota archaeon]